MQDAFCTLFYTEYFFIPEYLIGPRLQPLLTGCIILVHLILPCMHLYSILVVRAHVKTARYQDYLGQLQAAQGGAQDGLGNGATLLPPKKNLCAKCALREEELNGIYRCDSAGLKAFETTC